MNTGWPSASDETFLATPWKRVPGVSHVQWYRWETHKIAKKLVIYDCIVNDSGHISTTIIHWYYDHDLTEDGLRPRSTPLPLDKYPWTNDAPIEVRESYIDSPGYRRMAVHIRKTGLYGSGPKWSKEAIDKVLGPA